MDDSLKRREFFDLLGKGAAALTISGLAGCATDGGSEGATTDPPPPVSRAFMFGDEPVSDPLEQHIAMVVYPGMTLLDLIGPHTCFAALGMTIHLVWKTLEPIVTDSGITIVPTTTFEDCPRSLELLFIGGSSTSTATMIQDMQVTQFLRARAETAKLVTSVCTGSLILGGAGLLRGYRATSHWTVRDQLSIVGARPVKARYVQDRDRITGAGVTSGIDFGLRLVESLRGRLIAEATQLAIEYAPDPPFNAGTPDTASVLATGLVVAAWLPQVEEGRKVLEQARANF